MDDSKGCCCNGLGYVVYNAVAILAQICELASLGIFEATSLTIMAVYGPMVSSCNQQNTETASLLSHINITHY